MRVGLVFDEKHTVFRVIIKVTEKLVIIRWTIIWSLMLRTILYTIWCVLCYYTVILKHTDLNIIEFLPIILLFPEDCTSSGLSQDPSDKKLLLIWKYSLGSTLQFALFKIKIRLLKSDQKCLRHGSSTKPFISLCKRDNTTKKTIFLEK